MAVVLFAALSVPAFAEQETPPEVRAYSDALNSLLRSKERQSIEPVFARAQAAGRSLAPILETLPPAVFASLRQDLKGMILNREEVIVADPDWKYFSKLAHEKGVKTDQAFFSLYAKTRPDGVWPAYIEQQTDYSGCVNYGEKALVDLYGKWSGFMKQYPSSYAAQAVHELREIGSKLTEGTCACGGKEAVIAEFEAFLNAFPQSPISPVIKERLSSVRAGTSRMRFKCLSG